MLNVYTHSKGMIYFSVNDAYSYVLDCVKYEPISRFTY